MNMHILHGTAEDWGLPPARLQALDAELADHAACLAERGNLAGASELQARVNTRRGRRALADTHLAEQVAATLGRWPSRSEWRELSWLLAWFVVIIASDIVSMYATSVGRAAGFNDWGNGNRLATPAVAGWVAAAWFMQGLARAGFFTSFTVSLVHAWRTGKGVLLARILQLKLIHTVLVVAALWAFGNQLFFFTGTSLYGGWLGNAYIRANWPDWLTAPYLLAYGLVLAAVLLAVSKRRWWHWSLGVVLLALFLYPAAPVKRYHVNDRHPIVSTGIVKATGEETKPFVCYRDGQVEIIPNDDPAELDRVHKIMLKALSEHKAVDGFQYMDFPTNTYRQEYEINAFILGSVFKQRGPWHPEIAPKYRDRYYVTRTKTTSFLPLFSINAALSWLAAPIPVLGLIGLLGLLVLMGRRSLVDMVVYACLVFIALASTFLPFFYAGTSASIVNFTPTGVVEGPLPGFDSLLIGSPLQEVWTLILGLLLSAGIPWLLVALFLKPKPARLPDDLRIAE